MDSVISIPNCACGMRMTVSHTPDVFVCMNCDGLQPQESGANPRPRIKSKWDKAFDAEMERRFSEWYPEQGGKK